MLNSKKHNTWACTLQGDAKCRTMLWYDCRSIAIMPTTHESPHVTSPMGLQKRAPFVVIEGLDRSGKTTQINLLHSRLESVGTRTRLLKFPGMYPLISVWKYLYWRRCSPLHDTRRNLYWNIKRSNNCYRKDDRFIFTLSVWARRSRHPFIIFC